MLFTEKIYRLNFVFIRSCWSYIGQIGGMQPLSIIQRCLRRSGITHELMHALGFGHEHGRPDRDRYTTIHPENIARGYRISSLSFAFCFMFCFVRDFHSQLFFTSVKKPVSYSRLTSASHYRSLFTGLIWIGSLIKQKKKS